MSSPPPPADAPAETHQASQATVAAVGTMSLDVLWPDLDLTDLAGSLPAFKAAVAQSVIAHSRASATLAVRQYEAQRAAAGVTGRFRPLAADPPPAAQVAGTVDWATKPLWSKAVLDAHAHDAAPEVVEKATGAIAEAKARLAAGNERLVGDTGARTILENVQKDAKARGYARIPEEGACALCLMLASRGSVYKHDRGGRMANGRGADLTSRGIKKGQRHGDGDSFAVSNAKFTGAGSIKVHDHCRCHPEPVFGVYEMSSRARAAEQLWVVAGEGRGGKSARDAYRAAVEGFTNDKHGEPYFTPEQAARIAEIRRQL